MLSGWPSPPAQPNQGGEKQWPGEQVVGLYGGQPGYSLRIDLPAMFKSVYLALSVQPCDVEIVLQVMHRLSSCIQFCVKYG